MIDSCCLPERIKPRMFIILISNDFSIDGKGC